jgi:ATP-dependent HslUV protease subunit HslV
MLNHDNPNVLYGTTVLCLRRQKDEGPDEVVMIADGQVSLGNTVLKGNARKIKVLSGEMGKVLLGFAGATADAFTLFERLESKLQKYSYNLRRACVELARDWRTDKYLRKLEAMMIVADKDASFIITGSGDVVDPEGHAIAIGSGGHYALSAARALTASYKSKDLLNGHSFELIDIAKRSMQIASEICIYSNSNFIIETLSEVSEV